jgi:hypothetical protein
MKKLFVIILALTLLPSLTLAAGIIDTVRGRIVLQVEKNGEAWYLNPTDDIRYYMGRPADAFALMRQFGLGITNENLNKIPIGLIPQSGLDTDKDGLVDLLETAIKTNLNSKDTDNDGYDDKTEVASWYDPDGPKKLQVDMNLVNMLKGRILLQVQTNGEAWYVNPADGKRYFLGRPEHAFEIMRNLGLGITDADLETIKIGEVK